MNSKKTKKLKLGILGGGQLARMMALKTHELGIQPIIYSAEKEDPAAQVTSFHFQGDTFEKDKIKKFLQHCDVVTFESEFLDGKMLNNLSIESKTPIFPHPLLMEQLQDRATQKKMLIQYNLPTAASIEVSSLADLEMTFDLLGPQIVLKKRRFGYDGYGTFFINANKDQKSQWKNRFENAPYGYIAECFVPFKRELAILLARDQSGNISTFPMVESHQTKARCDWVMGPVHHPKEKVLIRKLKKFIQKINYVGVIAFELFDTGKELLINEIAPRVHNSGHYSQNAMAYDQFQTHIMAISGLKLPNNKLLSQGFAMSNLLGQTTQEPNWPSTLQAHLHWYGKKENRPDRKMGHLNVIAANPKKALQIALKERKKIKL